MTPQELKESIISLAVQGKLVPQIPIEGTAENLILLLKREKEIGIKKGLWSKSKSLSKTTDNDFLFEIPESWRWIKIGEISSLVTKGTTPRGGNVSYLNNGVGFLRAENVAGFDRIDKTNLKYIDNETHLGYLKRSILQANDILITIAGTLGRTTIVRENDLPLNANQAVSIIRLVNTTDISLKFLIYALNAPEIQKYLVGQKKITAIPNLTLEIIENCLIPIPPLAEQQRIVAKIEELLPLIDRYETAWSRLEEFNKRFPDDMQKSILQMAIQGKLIEQRPEEGTGEELYKQIQSEKQSLIKAGKIKKEKPLPPITDDEIPFEIPDSWKWVRVASLFNVGTGMTPLKSDSRFYLNGTIPWVNSALTSQRFIKQVDTYITQYALQNTSLSLYPAHTLIIAMYGQGKTRGQTSELLIPATINQACAALDSILFFQEMVDFVYFYFQYNYEILRKKAEGTSQPNLNLQKIKETLIPLPPLAEQKRIVTKIEELLPLCERLKKD